MTCRTENEMTADVAVIGGGTAGVFAAIAAARTGAKTVLIEKNGILGGTMTVANVNYPGLFFAWGKQIIDGPCWEAIQRTAALGGAVLPGITYKPEHHWQEQIRLNRFIFTTVLFQMCEEAGVEVLCHAMLSCAAERDDSVKLTVTGKNGMISLISKTAIDATGDANLIQMLGYSVMSSPTLQPATLQNHISGYREDGYRKAEIAEKMTRADLPKHISHNDILHYLKTHTISAHIPCCDAHTSPGKTRLEMQARFDTLKIYRFLRTITGLEALEIDFAADETGVRETNRIEGEHIISAEEYIHGVFYPDSVCYAFYPIDLHVMDGIQQTFHSPEVVSKIPYSSLIPKNAAKILCAGRCISSDTYANSAIRVEATCMAAGQAAGCAAALAANGQIKVTDVPYAQLCGALNAIGAIVPQK